MMDERELLDMQYTAMHDQVLAHLHEHKQWLTDILQRDPESWTTDEMDLVQGACWYLISIMHTGKI